MATEVKVPSLGESISSGILAGWQVKDGDRVEKDQVLYELETDKITSEGTAEVSGVISLKVSEGDEVEIGQVIAEIDDSGDSASAPAEGDGEGKEKEASDSGDGDSGSGDDSGETDKAASAPTPSPAVRRIAEESGLDPSEVKGTGKGGRVTKGDMLAALEKRGEDEEPGEDEAQSTEKPAGDDREAPAVREVSAAPETSRGGGSGESHADGDRESRTKLSPLRRSIANRLVSVQNESAILTTFNEADMSAVIALRKKHQDDFVARHGVKLGFMSFFVKAVVGALKEVSALNARLEGEDLVRNHYFDIGVAVSTDRGLLVPVLRDCDSLSMGQIENSLGDYAKKAREGKITIEDLQGGVFSITNGGVFGSLLSTPIINPPQSGILGMHTIQERPVAVDGQVVIRPMMYLALSYDHRIVDGREAVGFLVAVKKFIEDPARLLFG